MRRLRNSLLVLSLACAGLFAQTAEDLESPAVNAVAQRLNCPCGCKMNMACRMDPYPCRTCWENKKKIFKMEQAGMSQQAILAQFAQDEGKDIIATPPGVVGSITFYSAGILGLILVIWVIRKYRQKGVAAASAPELDSDELRRYHEQIEKETATLD